MKYVISTIAAALFMMAGINTAAQAQTLKFGHINSQELLQAMPERDSAEAKLRRLTQTIENQLEELQVEFNKKYQEYLQKRDTYSSSIKEMKERELTEMQQRAQEFQQVASQDLQRQQSELMKPVIDKADAAIKKVGSDNGFIYIFDVSNGTLLYQSDKSIDVLPMVKKELGIK
ncbi:MAG: OmpH family outer membrane protein [Bacteroidales bacterium]|nr:OmpH family outer membrane protein [Bacteroidales bacterium]